MFWADFFNLNMQYTIKFNPQTGLGSILIVNPALVGEQPTEIHHSLYFKDLTAEEIGQMIG